MSSFLQMKKAREAAGAGGTSKLVQQLQEAQSGGNYKEDDRFYYPKRNEQGAASVIGRFLPAPGGCVPFVKEYSHSFKGPTGKWYIENCPTTIGLECPVCEENGRLWNSGLESNKEIVRGRSRSTSFVSNYLVLKDPASPELEGKQKLIRYGKKIFDKITGAASPQFPDDPSIDVFDLWSGANFNWRIVKKDKQTNYDDSKFLEQSALSDDDAVLEGYYNNLVDLGEFTAPAQYKSYEELTKKFLAAIGSNTGTAPSAPSAPARQAPSETTRAPGPSSEAKQSAADAPFDGGKSVDEDDPISYFESLGAKV